MKCYSYQQDKDIDKVVNGKCLECWFKFLKNKNKISLGLRGGKTYIFNKLKELK